METRLSTYSKHSSSPPILPPHPAASPAGNGPILNQHGQASLPETSPALDQQLIRLHPAPLPPAPTSPAPKPPAPTPPKVAPRIPVPPFPHAATPPPSPCAHTSNTLPLPPLSPHLRHPTSSTSPMASNQLHSLPDTSPCPPTSQLQSPMDVSPPLAPPTLTSGIPPTCKQSSQLVHCSPAKQQPNQQPPVSTLVEHSSAPGSIHALRMPLQKAHPRHALLEPKAPPPSPTSSYVQRMLPIFSPAVSSQPIQHRSPNQSGVPVTAASAHQHQGSLPATAAHIHSPGQGDPAVSAPSACVSQERTPATSVSPCQADATGAAGMHAQPLTLPVTREHQGEETTGTAGVHAQPLTQPAVRARPEPMLMSSVLALRHHLTEGSGIPATVICASLSSCMGWADQAGAQGV
ncbi:hypothetical protein DUNSADRAFT_6755, partial [Dunaliella salina]